MSLAGKSPAQTYRSLLKMHSDTDGITTTSTRVYDGNGQQSSVLLSDDQFMVRPTTHDTSNNFTVADKSGTHYVNASGADMVLKVGSTLTAANTQLLMYSCHSLSPTAGPHYFMPVGDGSFSTFHQELAGGTGADPLTIFDAGNNTDDLTQCLFYVPFNITIDSVKAFVSTDASNDTSVNVHFNSYTISNNGDTNDGNLSAGAVIAAGNATDANYQVIKQIDCSVSGTADVSAGKVLACFVENETNTDKLMVKVQVVYHIA